MRKKVYLAAAVTVVAGLLLTACGGGTPETVVVTAPPEEVEVEVTVPVEITAPPEPGADRCTYNAYRMGWVMDYGDANNIVNEVFHPDAPFQYTFWDDEDFRSLVDQALTETDNEARAALWQDAQAILLEEHAAILPLFHYDRTGLINPDLEYEYPAFGQPMYQLWSTPEGQDTLRVRLATEPPSLDVNLATDTTSHLVQAQLMEGLYRYREGGALEPAGAESYEVSDDGTVYTVNLAEDATWSDGEPVLAQHYVDSIIRLLEPETAAEYAYVMYYIAGAEAFNTGETDDPATVGVTAVDDYTLEFTLESPQAFFPAILAFFTTWPIRLDVVEEYGDQWTEPGNMVSNGAYVLTEWAHEDSLTVEKNPNYHMADEVTIETIEFPIIIEDATALAAYERGELDVSGYPSEERSRIMEEMPDHFVRLPYPGTYYIGLNTALEPTDNVNLRKAMISSVDRRAILDAVLDMPWRTEACGVIPPEIMGYQACGEVGFEYDLDAAAEYLDAAIGEMEVEEAGEISVELWFNRGNEEVIEPVEEQWETNLGINVNVVNMEWGVYLDTLDHCND